MRKLLMGLSILLTQQINAQTPTFDWAHNFGNTGTESGYRIATDGSGNTYITGSFQDTVDFDPGTGVFNLFSAGGDDIFVLKLNGDGNFIWAKNMGGTGNDLGRSISVDGSGNVYLTGYYQNTADFDPEATIFNLTSNGGNDIFIEKLDANGNFVWAKSMGGTGSDQCVTLTIDAAFNVYTTGTFQNTVDFDPGTGTFNLVSQGGNDIFIQKLDQDGNFVWANSIGGPGLDWGYSIATDNLGGFYITGIFQNTIDFDPGAGTTNLTAIGGIDSYVKKFDANGNFIWAVSMGGTGTVFSYALTTDNAANVYTTGFFQSTIDFDPGAGTFNLTAAGNDDAFIQKLDGNGNFIWAKRTGGADNDRSFAITTDSDENVYTTGSFVNLVDFDPNAGTFDLTSAGVDDIFIQKLDSSGNFLWANNVGGTAADIGQSISVDNANNVFTTGTFQGAVDFDPTAGTSNLNSAGGDDIFIQKLKQCVPVNGTDVRSECDSLTWIDGITYYADNNTATDTIFGGSVNGCDSIVTLNLTITSTPIANPTSDIINCEGESVSVPAFSSVPSGAAFNWNNDNTSIGLGASGIGDIGSFLSSSSGVANIDYTPTLNGCVGPQETFIITINPISYSTDTVQACDSLQWIDGITYYTNNNTATHTITNGAANGCDSVITLNLTINDSSTNHIEGTINFQGSSITSGEVTLYRKNSNAPDDIFQFDSTFVDGSGFYFFDGVSAGDYMIKALGDTTLYNNSATYADSIGHWQWASIKTISFGCNDSIFNVDINLIELPTNNGAGSIMGVIEENGGVTAKAPGDPLGDIDITVEQHPTGAISSFDISNEFGEFNFDSLPAGDYFVYADIPGFVCDTTQILTFDGSGRNYEITLCVYDTINTIEICNNVITGNPETLANTNFNVKPNPSNGIVFIDFPYNQSYAIEITDISGKRIKYLTPSNSTIDLSSLKKGIYILTVITDKTRISKKLIME